MRGTRAPHRTRVAVVAIDAAAARPGSRPVRGSAALPASSLKAPCAGPFGGGRVRPRIIYNYIYACLRYPAVRACAYWRRRCRDRRGERRARAEQFQNGCGWQGEAGRGEREVTTFLGSHPTRMRSP